MPDFITLPDLVRGYAQRKPGHPAVIDGERQVTYAELDAMIDGVAAAMQRDGIRPRDAISICAFSSIEYVATFLGALRIGVAVAPLPPSSTPADFAAMVKDADAKILFMDESAAALMGDAGRAGPSRRVSFDGDTFGQNFGSWIAKGSKPQTVTVDPEWTFNIIYSSGTTGTPKGIVHTHHMRWRQYGQLDPLGYGPDAITLLSTPLYSNTTLVCFNPTLAGGGTLVLMKKFDAQGFLELAQKHRVTHAMLVPVQYRRIMALPNFDSYDLTSFVMKFSTSAPFAAEIKADVLKRWPGGLTEFYGMTEGGGSFVLLAHEHPTKLHTVGQPMPDHEVMLIGEDGKPVAQGEIGDVGRFDEDGFLTLMDRKKDMIITGGFNVYPSDIEAVVMQQGEVVEVAVVAMPSEEWGETPVAFVVLKPGAKIDAAGLKAYTNARVGKIQRLNDVEIVDVLPRSAIGKVLKRELRDRRIAARG